MSGASGDHAVVLVLTSLPDNDSASRIAQVLVGERLAACVNISAPGTSLYRWQGVIETATEVQVLCKTSAATQAALIGRLAELHPYEVPEILAWTPREVASAYAAWVIGQTGSSDGE